MFATFSFVNRIHFSSKSDGKILLPIYSVAVGSGIWGIQFVNLLAFQNGNVFKFSTPVMLSSWFFGWLVGLIICHISSKKLTSFPLLIIGSLIAGLCSYAMFYLAAIAIHTASNVSLDTVPLLIALFLAVTLCLLTMLTLSWMKEYTGENALLIKLILSLFTAAAVIGLHVSFSASITLQTDASIALEHVVSNKKMLVAIISLSIACLFLLVFVVAMFYEKHGYKIFSFNRFETKKETENSLLNMMDGLTNLPNRIGFQHNLENAISRSERSGKTIALAYIDLDHFKPINDNYGHQVGDVVLASSASRLNAAVRGCDSLARIGGDEFIAIIEGIKSNEDISPIVERIVNSINQPFLIDNQKIDISCSVGIAIYPGDGDTEKLMACADAAMYKAKENGKNQFKFYDAEIELAADKMLELQCDLMIAIEKKEFSLVFQPKVDCKSLELIGAEAFISWNHPTKGLLLPNLFIPAAERFGLINQINNWVIEEACVAIYRAKKSDIDLNLSINLSRIQFRNSSLVDDTIKCLDKYGVPSQNLTLEIKETTAIRNEAQFKLLIAKFKAANIKIALDDFGLNPFTLEYLQELNVDELKLDNVFVSKVNENPESHALVDAVIRLAHAFNLNVVAEGVETETQRRALAELGCDHMQGYLYSKPITEAKLLKMFKSQPIQFELTSPAQMDNNLSEVI
jgi:diguanylate cyclase (GGDEF)-like protein